MSKIIIQALGESHFEKKVTRIASSNIEMLEGYFQSHFQPLLNQWTCLKIIIFKLSNENYNDFSKKRNC
jgi:hypothetical protein